MEFFLDFLGQETRIGDTVVITAPKYRSFVKGTVIAITPKNARIEFYNNWNYGTPRKETLLAAHGFVIKVLECELK